MKLRLYQRNIMIRAIKNRKVDDNVKVLFLVELVYYNSLALREAVKLMRYLQITAEAKENLKEILKSIYYNELNFTEAKIALAEKVLTRRLEAVEANVDVVYMMYDKRAFTFLSVLISIVIIFMTAYILSNVFTQSIRTNAFIENKIKAVYLAQEKMEELQAQSFNSIISEPLTAVSDYPGFYEQVNILNLTNNGKKITVTVNFPGGKASLVAEKYFSPYE